MDERARKRKLEELEDYDGSEVEGVEKELPKQGLKLPQEKKTKKQKISKDATDLQSTTAQPTVKAATSDEKRQAKLERKQAKKDKKQKKTTDESERSIDISEAGMVETKVTKSKRLDKREIPDSEAEDNELPDEQLPSDEIEHFEAEGLEDADKASSTTSTPPSPMFDNTTEPSAATSTSSTSSAIPPAKAPKHIKLPSDPELLRSRLAARIEALRAARKADGSDGFPARNRQELLEARRKKEEQRRAHKKELRLKAKAEEDARREAALVSSRNSPASSFGMGSPRSPEHNFSFGRVAFADGQHLADDLSGLKSAPKKKGPQDAASALAASEKKRLRISGLDETKRADIEQKDLWLNAKKKANGERVRDDTSLLKKTLKREDKMKKKSAKEWGERIDGVKKSQAMKQKKREANLKERREGKGVKGKGKKKSVKGKKPKVKSRPGFEGSFGSGKRK